MSELQEQIQNMELKELKATAYDAQSVIQQHRSILETINAAIQERASEEETVPAEPEEDTQEEPEEATEEEE